MSSLYSFDPQPSVVKRCEKHLAAYHLIGHISPLNDQFNAWQIAPIHPPKSPIWSQQITISLCVGVEEIIPPNGSNWVYYMTTTGGDPHL